jgi:hypothetical protein
MVSTYLSTHPVDAIVSNLYFCNPTVAGWPDPRRPLPIDRRHQVTSQIRVLNAGASQSFMPQCGLAPGFISIVTHDLMTHFRTLDTVKMRVGALRSINQCV